MDWWTWLLFGERWPSGATWHDASWSLRASPSWWLLIPLILLGLASIVWFYRREKLSRLARGTLIALRVATFLILALLICRPTLEATLRTQRPRPIVLLIDNSLSMSLQDPRPTAADKLRMAMLTGLLPISQGIAPDASLSHVPEKTPETLSRAEIVRLVLAHPELKLLEKLAAKGPVQVKLFGAGVTSSQLPLIPSSPPEAERELRIPGFTASEPKTALGDAIMALVSSDIPAERPAAIIALTDGLEQGGQISADQAAQKCKQLEIPLYCFGVGSSDFASLQFKSLMLPDALLLEDTVSTQMVWRANGLQGKPLSLVMTLGDMIVGRKEIMGKDGESITQTIPFVVPKNLRSDGPVDFTVTMSGPALTDSPQSQVEFSKRVRLLDRKVRVLVVDQAPRFETKFLMASLMRDRRVEAAFHFTGNDPAGMQNAPFLSSLPASRPELFHYDLIFLGDVPPEAWGTERLTWLRDLVREGGGLVMIAGKKFTPAAYMNTPLAAAIPVESATTMPVIDDSLKTELYHPSRSAAGQRHEMLALADSNEENEATWRELSGFYAFFPATKLRPGALSLLNHPTQKLPSPPEGEGTGGRGQNTLLPIMAIQRYGRGEVLYLGVDEIWRWRANVGDKYYSRFWGQVIYQLGLPRLLGGARRVHFSLERVDQFVGQPGFVYVRAYDHDFQPLGDARLQARIVPLDRHGKPSGEPVQPLTLESAPGQAGEYRALLPNDKVGRFLLTLDAPEPSQLPFHVDYPPNDERIPAPMAATNLKAWSELTGGNFYREEDLPRLSQDVRGLLGTFTFRRDAVMWNPLMLLIITGLLTAEWIVRKMTNLS
jgi:hypothetical protein